jgi:ubiquinone biosynthesis protein UbiJ
MLETLTTGAVCAVLNRMLARETWAREKLAPFAGRVARLSAPPFTLALAVTEGGTFADAAGGEPAVTIGVDAAALPLAIADPQALLRNVKLEGDADFAQALSAVLQNLRPEPEEELSRFVGDAAAERIVGFARTSASHWRQLAERIADSGAHYVVTENPMVAPRAEVEAFVADVGRLRDDVARFEKRLERLERSAGGAPR